jgi:hypothetical protein
MFLSCKNVSSKINQIPSLFLALKKYCKVRLRAGYEVSNKVARNFLNNIFHGTLFFLFLLKPKG